MVEDEDGTLAGHQEQAWKRQEQLLNSQVARLRKLRDDLTAKWPPEKNQAAAVFIDKLDTMTAAMEAASVAAAEIRGGLTEVARTLAKARTELRPLAQQYFDKSAAWKAFNNRAFQGLPDQLVPDRPIPGIQALEPLILRAHQRSLDERAREVLKETDDTVLGSWKKFVELPDYDGLQPGETWDPTSAQLAGAGEPSATNTSANGSLHNLWPTPKFDPPSPFDTSGESSENTEGLRLTGTTTQSAPRVDTTANLVVNHGASAFSLAGSTTDSMLKSGGLLGTHTRNNTEGRKLTSSSMDQSVARFGSTTGPTGSGSTASTVRSDLRAAGAVPGVITGAHGSNTGSRPSGVNGTTRNYSGSSGGRPTITVTGMEDVRGSTTARGYRDPSYDEYTGREPRELDSGNPWVVKQGVAPVLRPSSEDQRHDPGRGVLGIDR